MNIRAVTGFLDPGWPLEPKRIQALAACLASLREGLTAAGYQIQTTRLATPPPAEFESPVPVDERPVLARQLEAECFVHGIDYANLGPVLPDDLEGYAMVPEVLAAAENIFCSGLYADPEVGLSLTAARACAEAILGNSTVSPDGFANLRFAGLANVAAGSPFFPAAYHRTGPPAVAIATEAADLAVDSLREVNSLQTARRRLVSMIEAHAAALEQTVAPIATEHNVRWLGTDFSLAPFPEPGRSIGTALELLAGSVAGQHGSTAAAAFLTDCLDQAQFQRTGFCGLFLPVLEDSILAERIASGELGLADLLLMSTVCGTGLDTIPLPGDVQLDALTGLLLDLGALALRQAKPLTARLMPIPRKVAGDQIHFDFPYFADSRVMELTSDRRDGLFGSDGILDLGRAL